ncbi:hypothetical protein [Solobacterium moorei]|uniref:hypothetical protein n=2 Tax=Solobacterium moorei TaxID=102148 RepID=UPI002B2916E4|nr:hypothetical protein RGT18_08020 [Solobacterium moorei]
MIKLNAKGDHVEVAISGSSADIARELHALLNTIKNSEAMQVALMVALTVDAISEEEHKENTDGMSEMLKRVFGKGNNNENFMS